MNTPQLKHELRMISANNAELYAVAGAGLTTENRHGELGSRTIVMAALVTIGMRFVFLGDRMEC